MPVTFRLRPAPGPRCRCCTRMMGAGTGPRSASGDQGSCAGPGRDRRARGLLAWWRQTGNTVIGIVVRPRLVEVWSREPALVADAVRGPGGGSSGAVRELRAPGRGDPGRAASFRTSWQVLANSRFAPAFRLARARTDSCRPRQHEPAGRDRTCPRWPGRTRRWPRRRRRPRTVPPAAGRRPAGRGGGRGRRPPGGQGGDRVAGPGRPQRSQQVRIGVHRSANSSEVRRDRAVLAVGPHRSILPHRGRRDQFIFWGFRLRPSASH